MTSDVLIRAVTLVLAGFFACTKVAAQAPPSPQPATSTVAIIYDGPDLPLADGFLGAHYIKNLLGHFALRGELIRLADYQPGQLSRYRAAFYVGSVAKTDVPRGFLRDVKSSKQPFCWLGRHVDQLLRADAQHEFGLRYYRVDRTAWRVRYEDTLFPRDNFNLSIVEPADGRAKIVATAVRSDNTTRPYVLNRDRFWYFADTPFGGAQEGSRYLVFCDLLHDIVEIYHAPQSAALIRMEDVSAEAEPGDLTAVADVLSRRNIPFQIATIPLYRNPLNNVEMRLSERLKVVDAIHYMIIARYAGNARLESSVPR